MENKIKELRNLNKISQKELSDILNISRQTISDWERGYTYPSVENLIKLKKIFNTTLDYLILGIRYDESAFLSPVEVSNIVDLNKLTKGFYLGDINEKRCSITCDNDSSIIVGETGSGKSEIYITNKLISLIKKDAPIILADFKFKNFFNVKKLLEEYKYNINILNMSDIPNSKKINIFKVFDMEDINEFQKFFCFIYISEFDFDLFWRNEEIQYLFNFIQENNIKTIFQLYFELNKFMKKEELNCGFEKYEEMDDKQKEKYILLNTIMRDTILQEKYSSFLELLSGNDINVENLTNNNEFLFISGDLTESIITRKFSSRIVNVISDYCLRNNAKKINLIIDEYEIFEFNESYIKNISNKNNIDITVATQNINKLNLSPENINDIDLIIYTGGSVFLNSIYLSNVKNIEMKDILSIKKDESIIFYKNKYFLVKKHYLINK